VGTTLVVTKALRVRPKLRDDQTNAVLRLRPRLGEVLTSMPGGTFASRCVYDDNAGPDGDTSEGFRDPYRYSTFSVPSVHFRRYDRPVCARGQVVVSQGAILPDTYRHHRFPRLVNMYVNDAAPLFGQVRQSLRSPMELDGPYFYFDSEWPGHFGHTVTEQISRLWALSEARRLEPDLKLLMTVQRKRSPQRLAGWETELLSSFGFREGDVEIFDEPVRPLRLYAATPMFSCPDYVHPGIAAVWSAIGSRLAAQSVRTDLPPRLFCSRRTTLKRACRNTDEVEQLFASHGFEIVFPEDHSLADQVAMFRTAEVIAGFAGSALFNIAFCETPCTVLMITPESYTARNEYLFASVRGHRLHTIWTRPDTPHPPGRWTAEAFSSSFAFDFEREGAYARRLLNDLDGIDAESPRSSGQKRG
jgi:capsular polysaccharide biosynthesis protein